MYNRLAREVIVDSRAGFILAILTELNSVAFSGGGREGGAGGVGEGGRVLLLFRSF
jgi:hypothetical protein